MNSLSVYGQMPDPLAFIERMGEAIAKSRLFGCENESQGKVLAMTCVAKQMDPLSLAQRYDIIQGNLSKKADAILAEFRSIIGGRHKIIERTPEAAEIELSLDGNTERFRFTWSEAEVEPFTKGKGGTLKDNYATPRARMQMLWARVVSDGVRAMAPEVICGVYTPEEIGDFQEPCDGGTPAADAVAPRPSAPLPEPSVSSVIDAEFRVVDQSANNLATGPQIKRISELFRAMNVPADKQLAAFKKREADSMASLTSDGATDLITAMEAILAKSTSETVGESKADQEAIEQPSDGPASTAQVQKAKSLLAELVKRPGYADAATRVKAKLVDAGLQQIADLSRVECNELIQSIAAENLETFFDSTLAGWPAGE